MNDDRYDEAMLALTAIERGYRLTPEMRAVLLRYVDRKVRLTWHPRTWYLRLRGLLPASFPR